MHIYLTLSTDGSMEVPLQYNHIVQAMIYDSIDPDLATFLHEKGYQTGSRVFKLFTFSRLLGPFQIDRSNGLIRFKDKITLVISSPFDEFCQSIANGILIKSKLRLGKQEVKVEKMAVQQYIIQKEQVVLKCLSPVVVYSTFFRPDGRKYTCYFQPGETDHELLLEKNLRKKYRAFHRTEAPSGRLTVRKIGRGQMRLVKYKDTVIKGYSGKLALKGPRELLQMAVDAGIGSKNSQGFGCVEIIKEKASDSDENQIIKCVGRV
ncbi:MAG: CRISPR-associated endoribonuclease Cas6 [Bacillota bacterium]|jgi:CRISPR-associated endoribonuclease Cas6